MPIESNVIHAELIPAQEELALTKIDLIGVIRSVLEKKAACRFRVRGFSMSPFIKDGDVVTVSRSTDRSVGLGRAAAFVFPKTGKLVIHRVVGVKGNSYLIKGDSTLVADGLVPGENILGFVTKVEREGKAVTLGLGPERFLIAFLSRTKALSLIAWFWKFVPLSFRRHLL
jgi:hypothetical protein